MRKAIELARKGQGFTSPNPCVGAVVVNNGKIVGEGRHKKAGEDHAEIDAIKNTPEGLTHGAEMYVTLEPCAHVGKTGACAGAIAEARFKKVFVGMQDPFEKVNGSGVDYLRSKGVEVEVLDSSSDLGKEILLLNQPFLKAVKKKIPYIVLKSGISLDGKTALKSGESKWITSEKSRKDARLERSKCDAVLVGFNTVLFDNPSLSPTEPFSNKKLLKIILDPLLKSDLQKKVFEDGNVFVACAEASKKSDQKRFIDAGIEFAFFGESDISLEDLLAYLSAHKEIQSVFVEGGSETHGMFLDKKLVDKVIFYVSPKLLGGRENKPAIGGEGIPFLPEALEIKDLQVSRIGEDIKLEGRVSLY